MVASSSSDQATVVEQFKLDRPEEFLQAKAEHDYEVAIDGLKIEVADAALRQAEADKHAKAAKSRFVDLLDDLSSTVAAGWEAFLPNKEGENDDGDDSAANEVVDGTTDDEASRSAADASAPDTKWEDRPLVQLVVHGVPRGTVDLLCGLGFDTMGRFERLRADISTGREKWPKGIGEAKITKLENAMIEWLTKNRDASVFQAVAVAVEPVVESQATAVAEPTVPAVDQSTVTAEAAPKKARKPRKPKDEQATLEASAIEQPPPVEVLPIEQFTATPTSQTPAEVLPVVPTIALPVEPLPPLDDGKFPENQNPSAVTWSLMSVNERTDWMDRRVAYLSLNPPLASDMSPVMKMRGASAASNGQSPAGAWIYQPGSELDSFLIGYYEFIEREVAGQQKRDKSAVDKMMRSLPPDPVEESVSSSFDDL